MAKYLRTNYCLHCGSRGIGPSCRRCINNARSFISQVKSLQVSISTTTKTKGFYSCNSFVERYNLILRNAKNSFPKDICVSTLAEILPERRAEEIPLPYTNGYLIAKMCEVELHAAQLVGCLASIVGLQGPISETMMNVLTNARRISDPTMDAVYTSSGAFGSFESAYSEAKRLMNVIEVSGVHPSYIDQLKTVVDEMRQSYDESENLWIRGLLQDNREMIRRSAQNIVNSINKLDTKVDNIRSQLEEDRACMDKFYALFSIPDASNDETKIFRNQSHSQLVRLFKRWLENKKSALGEPIYSIEIHSRHEAGIDILAEFSRSKIGIQIHSYRDIKGEKETFGSKVKRQIGDSLKHGLSGSIIIYCGDMMDPSQKDKILSSISEVSQMKKINIICVPRQKAVVIMKQGLQNN